MAISKTRMYDYYRTYKRNGIRELRDVYASYSAKKARAWRDCIGDEIEKNGYGLSVLTYNTNVFTAGFIYDSPNGKVFRVITPSNYGEIIIGGDENEIF